MRIESRIGAICQEHGISAKELARLLGTEAQRLMRPDVDVCQVLGVQVCEVLVLVKE